MDYDFQQKSTVDQIRTKFDRAADYFSNLETGQKTAMDSAFMMNLVASAAARTTPHATRMLDIGCGAGNYTLKLLEFLPDIECTLLDLSRPMLERAKARVSANTLKDVVTLQGDMREVELAEESFDIVVSGTALHHLRGDDEWEIMFQKVFSSLKPFGSFWVSDLVAHDDSGIQALMKARYGDFLVAQGGESFRDKLFADIEEEDTPRSTSYQINLLQKTGFADVDVLHKNACFAAFGGTKRS